MAVLQQYKCPSCGGTVGFDTLSQRMKCPYCDTEFDIEALKESQDNLDQATMDSVTWNSDETTWEQGENGAVVYVCNSCGGEIVGDSTTAATDCPYCGNPVIMKGQLSGDLKPDLVIPFKLDKKAAKEALRKHISTKKFIPRVFKDENHIDEIKGIYVPEWLFDCDTAADIIYRGEVLRTWSDNNFNYTEISVYDLQRSGYLKIHALPVDGSSKMDDDLMESIEPFNINEAVDFDTAYLSGFFADRYDVTAEQSAERANERVKQTAADAMRETIIGYTNVKAERSQIGIENGICKYALYPVWILNTTWKGQKFTFAMNGQTGKIVGDLPLDKSAFWKWVGILTPIFGAVTYAVMWLLFR